MSLEHPLHDNRLARRGPGPGLHLLVGGPSEAFDMTATFVRHRGTRAVARTLRGTKARTSRALFDECAAAWQFPPYFGENWDALDECLADLEWLPAEAYVFVITDASQLLADDKPEALATFVTLLEGVVRDRSRAIPGASFHVVFQVDPEGELALVDRLTKAKARFDRL